jgi:hypothetical protein
VPEARSLASSEDGKVLFIGGGADNSSGIPILAAVSFDKQLGKIAEIKFDEPNLCMVYCLKT